MDWSAGPPTTALRSFRADRSEDLAALGNERGRGRPNVRDHTGGAQSVPERLKTEVRKERSQCLHLERFPYNQATSHR